MSKFRGVKTDNAPIEEKRAIRRWALSCVESPKVLEVFCGSGEMYRDVWHNSDMYTGIDKRKFFDERHTLCGDAQKMMYKVDCDSYNIFDIDAYGSPYGIIRHILDNLSPKSAIAFCVTDGINMDLKMGRISKDVRRLCGIDGHIAKRAHLIHDELIKICINRVSSGLGMSVDGVKIARGSTGAAMRYYAFVLKPINP